MLDAETGTFDLRSVTYDVRRVVEDARASDSPSLADWDRSDVDSATGSGAEATRDDA